MNQTIIHRLVAFTACVLGVLLTIGGCLELVGIFLEGRLPIAVRSILQRLHHLLMIRLLVVFVGLSSMLIGVQMLSSFRGVLSAQKDSIHRISRAYGQLLLVLVISQIVLAVFLYPTLHTLKLPAPFPFFWQSSMISAALGPAVLSVLMMTLCTRIQTTSTEDTTKKTA